MGGNRVINFKNRFIENPRTRGPPGWKNPQGLQKSEKVGLFGRRRTKGWTKVPPKEEINLAEKIYHPGGVPRGAGRNTPVHLATRPRHTPP